MRIPIGTGTSKGRSIPLTAEKLVNMYPEAAPANAKSNVVVHGCPGLTRFCDIDTRRTRGLYRTSSDGRLYVVIRNTLYYVSPEGIATDLGTIAGSGRVGMSDNGTQLCIVAGATGYTYTVAGGLQVITDPDFPGANTVTFLDGFFIFNNASAGQRGQFFISNLLDGQVYDALDFATAEAYPDNLIRVFADHSQLLLFGAETIEVWFNAGLADFPFTRAQGSVIEQGLGARWTIAKLDETVVWLDNEGMVRSLQGNTPARISTHAIEYEITRGDWNSATAWSYVEEGHQFYVLTVPAANLATQKAGTYVYDAATQLWHERKSYRKDYSRSGFYAYAYGKHITADIDIGRLYEQSLDAYEEDGEHLIAEMQFPQVQNDGQRFIVDEMQIDMEAGGQRVFTQSTPVSGEWGQRVSGLGVSIRAVELSEGKSVSVGDDGKLVYSVTSGNTWAEKTSGFGTDHIYDVEYSGLLWMAVGDNGKKSTSADGDTWTIQNETAGVTYTSKSFVVSTQEPFLRGFCFSDNGGKMYVTGVNTQRVYQYNLSTAWDISTASYTGNSFLLSTQDSQPYDVFVMNDGSALYMIGLTTNDIFQYSMTGYDVSTLSFTQSFAPAEGGQLFALFFSPDGENLYTLSTATDRIYQYSLSTAWDISTASYTGNSFQVSSQEPNPEGIFLSPDGVKLFVNGQLNGIRQYSLGTAWNIATATYDGVVHNPSAQNTALRDIFFKDSGENLYTLDQGSGSVYQYDVNPPFELSGSPSDFSSIGFGGGKWIAGTRSGRLSVSTDSTSWSYIGFSLGDEVLAVEFGGRWVVVGGSGLMAISDDALSWSFVSSSFGGSNINGVASGDSKFVAVGDDSKIAVSASGNSWEQVPNPFTGNITGVAFSGNLWFASSDSGEIGVSEDAISWALVDSSFSGSAIYDVSASDSSGVAAGEAGKIATQSDDFVTSSVNVGEPMIMLDVSGSTRTFDMTQSWRSFGKQGEYDKRVIWRRLGQYRSFTPKVAISSPVKRAIFAAYAKIRPSKS